MTEPATETRPAPRCALCDKPAVAKYRPFCSAACRDRDLLRWLNGAYAIPSAEPIEVANDQERPEED